MTGSVRLYRLTTADPRNAKTTAARVVREVVGRALGVAEAEVEISRRCSHCGDTRHGKPTVVGAPDLSFSVSHSGAFALVAFATDGMQVGVDLEVMRPRSRLARLAARALDADDHRAFLSQPQAAQLEWFLRAWTAKESYLKAVGLGIATDLREISTQPDGWCMHGLDALPAYVATLAIDRDASVTSREWEPTTAVS